MIGLLTTVRELSESAAAMNAEQRTHCVALAGRAATSTSRFLVETEKTLLEEFDGNTMRLADATLATRTVLVLPERS